MFQDIRISGTGQKRIGRRAVGFVQDPVFDAAFDVKSEPVVKGAYGLVV